MMKLLGIVNNHAQMAIPCDQGPRIDVQSLFDELDPLRLTRRRLYLKRKPVEVPTVNPDKVFVEKELIACMGNGGTVLKEFPQTEQGGGQGLRCHVAIRGGPQAVGKFFPG